MGCVSSKNFNSSSSSPTLARPDSPRSSGSNSSGSYGGRKLETEIERVDFQKSSSSKKRDSIGIKCIRLGSHKLTQSTCDGNGVAGEQHVADSAAWPAWIIAVAPEAVEGWLPLRSQMFSKLEKIGQGTYSSVYRAHYAETGRLVALKKVRFNNMKPESVRFMAREIAILRKLDHPNIMKLEGIIASPSSNNIYLVFEYMEHDLSGLITSPEIKFSSAQIKCYMWQLLCGIEHCHSHGLIHRDIKTSNILVNNEGVLKIADFGLANFVTPKNQQQMTNRVVTLWYRPPEIFLGSTNYKETVDLWSVGCVFAEMFLGRPLLRGRNEVEQLHKIFKLCGTPSDEYWQKSKLPLATMFKPHHPYESSLRERCSAFPSSALNLLETLLSVEPDKRGTASSAFDSEYFSTRPYASDPSNLPKYSPSKEMDTKARDFYTRRNVVSRKRAPGALRDLRKSRKPLQESSASLDLLPAEEVEGNYYVGRRIIADSSNSKVLRASGPLEPSYVDTLSEISQSDSTQTLPRNSSLSSFAHANSINQDAQSRHLRSKTITFIDPLAELHKSQSSEDFLNFSEESSADYNDQYPRRPISLPLMKTGEPARSQDSHTHQTSQKSRFSRE